MDIEKIKEEYEELESILSETKRRNKRAIIISLLSIIISLTALTIQIMRLA